MSLSKFDHDIKPWNEMPEILFRAMDLEIRPK